MSALDITLSVLAGGGAGYAASFLRGPRRTAFRHEHAFGLWEECRLHDSEYREGRKVDLLVAGQMRDCLGCGEREVRRVVSAP